MQRRAAQLLVLCGALILGSATPAWARSARVEIDPPVVGVGEAFTYSVLVDVEIQSISPPDFAGFQLLGRTGGGVSISIGPGGMTRTVSQGFQLRALKVGTYRLGPAKVTLSDGTTMTTNPGTIQVVAEPVGRRRQRDPFDDLFGQGFPGFPRQPQQPQQPPPSQLPPSAPPVSSGPQAPPPAPPSAPTSEEEGQVFMRAVADKPRVYLGEPVTVTIWMYRRIALSRRSISREPTSDGFWGEDILGGRPVEQETLIGNVRYVAGPMWRQVLYGVSAGKKTIGPMTAEVATGFGGLFGGGAEVAEVMSKPLEVEVLPLPTAGRPDDFDDGNVGQNLTLTAQAEPARFKLGDPTTLKLVARGGGNAKRWKLPMPEIEGAKVYDPKVTAQVTGDPPVGERQVEHLVLPDRSGTVTIPAIAYTYFDTGTKTYRTVKSQPVALNVAPGVRRPDGTQPQAPGPGGATPAATPDRAAASATQLLPIFRHARLEAPSQALPTPGGAFYFTLAAAPLLLGLGLRAARSLRERSAEQRSSASGRARSAQRTAQKRLRELTGQAQQAGSGDGAALAFSEVARVLQQFVSDRFGVAPSGLTRGELRTLLQERKAPAATVERLCTELDNLDFARFAPASSRPAELRGAIDRATQLVTELDRA